MCDYSLHAVATRAATVGETIVTTTFRGTSTRGFAWEKDPSVAVCLLPGTELAFEENVRYENRWVWTRTVKSRVARFDKVDAHIPDRHHDAVGFADGKYVLVTQLVEGQRAVVKSLPVVEKSATTPVAAATEPPPVPSEPTPVTARNTRVAPVRELEDA